jgi:RimJ/RimL family protein N-acetyltransferase
VPLRTIDLVAITQDEAARICAATPGENDRWADGFPREDDVDPCAGLAAATEDPTPFGSYRIVPQVHGLTIGTAGFFGPPHPSGEVTIGYGMVEAERGKGYGTEVVAGLIEVCRRDARVRTVNADTDLDNVASQRVLEKNGFQLVRTSEQLCYFMLDLNGCNKR